MALTLALQRGLLGREPDGLPVHRVERAGHLTDLVAGADRDGLDRDVRRLTCAHALTACGSRRSATSRAELRSTRSDRISDRDTSTAIVMPTSRPSMRMTELMPGEVAGALGGGVQPWPTARC